MAHESEDMFTGGKTEPSSASVVAPHQKPYKTITYVECMDLMEMQRDLPPDVLLQTSDSSYANDEIDVAMTDVSSRSKASVTPLRMTQKRLSTSTLNNRSDNYKSDNHNHPRPGGKENYHAPTQNAKNSKPITDKRNSLESGLVPRAITKQQNTTAPVCSTTRDLPGSASCQKLKEKTPDSSGGGSLPSSSSMNKQSYTDGSISGTSHTPARLMSLANNSVRPCKVSWS